MNNPKSEVLFHQRPDSVPDVTKQRTRSTRLSNAAQNKETKKLFVRNSEMTVSSTLYKTDTSSEEDVSNDCPSHSSQAQDLYKTDLSVPNLNSALRIVKEMNVAQRKSSNNSRCIKLVDEGKVLQKVNFPYEEHLYRDLVALNVSHTSHTGPVSSARLSNKYPIRERDKEPQLSQFFTPSYSSEYSTIRQPPTRSFESLRCSSASIYQRICSWDIRE